MPFVACFLKGEGPEGDATTAADKGKFVAFPGLLLMGDFLLAGLGLLKPNMKTCKKMNGRRIPKMHEFKRG